LEKSDLAELRAQFANGGIARAGFPENRFQCRDAVLDYKD
jgi:hypothetical protein